MSLVRGKGKIPSELLQETEEQLVALASDHSFDEKIADDACSNLYEIRSIIEGDTEVDDHSEILGLLNAEAFRREFLRALIIGLLPIGWEGRRDVAEIWSYLLKAEDARGFPAVECLAQRTSLLDMLVKGYENKEIALTCGAMVRDCCRHPRLVRYLLESPCLDTIFKSSDVPSFDISSDAFATLKELVQRHKPLVAQFLNAQFEKFFSLYESLVTSDNYVTRRQSLKLLGELLLDRANVAVMLRFIADVHNLRLMMTLLKDSSKSIQYEAFHVFKVFVANPKKPEQIVKTLARNKQKLLVFLDNFDMDKDDEEFDEEKDMLKKEIEKLPTIG